MYLIQAFCMTLPDPGNGHWVYAGNMPKTNPGASPATGDENAENSFEQCLARLQSILNELEKPELPLEQSMRLFEEGMRLSDQCRRQLEAAEGKMEILLKRNGQVTAQEWSPEGEN